MNTAKYRPLLRRLHRWVALALTPVFAIVILSGGVLALKPLFAPAAVQTNSAEGPAIAAALARIDPQGLATSVAVSPDGGSLVLQSRGSTGPSGSFDPASGIANAEQPGPDFFAIVLDLHKNLLLGLGIVVEIAAYAMSALIVVGLFLGLPRLRNTLLGWHQGVAWLALPLVVLAPLTGTLMALHIGTPSLPPIQQGPPIALASAIGSVAGQPDSGALVSARRFRAGSALVTTQGQQGALRYLVEPNGRIHALSEGPGLVRELHEGTWGGALSAGVSFAGALALAGLTATGALSWWRRRRQGTVGSLDEGASTLVAFGSQTGTAARLAEATAEALRRAGAKVACASLEALSPQALAGYGQTLLIVSTTGEGELPEPARRFMKQIPASKLDGSRFSMLALGDRRYPDFCAGGEQLRNALLDRGANEFVPLERADADPAPAWAHWLDKLGAPLGLSIDETGAPTTDQPLSLTLALKRRLDDPAVEGLTETWQLGFEPEGATPGFRPGDLLLISPRPDAPPRCYSIGSSSLVGDRLIRLTVSLHRWQDEAGTARIGEASGYLCHGLALGDRIEATLRSHPGFNPPEDPSRPLIMVAAGAGVAPFPGFLAERAVAPDCGPNWLFFGNRRRGGDYFYRTSLERLHASGTLAHLDTAFSRDPEDGCHIDARLIEHGAQLFRWLERENGVLYMCGRSATLGKSVERALLEIIRDQGHRQPRQAEDLLVEWKRTGRLRVDVFG